MEFLEDNLEQFEDGVIGTASGLGIGIVSALVDPGLFKFLTICTSGYILGRNAPETICYFEHMSHYIPEKIRELRNKE